MQLFSVILGNKTEFSVIGIANVAKKTAKFQGLMNGIPFVEDSDYEVVREKVMNSIALNQPEHNAEAHWYGTKTIVCVYRRRRT